MRHLLMMVGSFYSIHGFRSGRFLPYIIDVVVMFFRSHIDIPLPSVWVSTSGDICCCSTVDELLLLCCDGSCVRWAHVHIVVTFCCGCTVRRFIVKVRRVEKKKECGERLCSCNESWANIGGGALCSERVRCLFSCCEVLGVGRCAVRVCIADLRARRHVVMWGSVW